MKSLTRRVTLSDVADATGFTINTVSRALKNKPDISRATCETIQKVASDMGYVCNHMASALRSGFSRTIGVIVSGMSNPFYAIMVDAIYDVAQKLGYTVLVMCSRDKAASEEAAVRTAIERQVDGMLLFPCVDSEANIRLLHKAHIPTVLVSRTLEGVDCNSVVCDEEMGGYLAGRYLLEQGCRRIVFCASHDVVFAGRRRFEGMRRALQEAGMPPDAAVRYLRESDEDASACLHAWQKGPRTGIFVFCDQEAWRLISLIDKNGLHDAFPIVGFDNVQEVLKFPMRINTVEGGLRPVAEAATYLVDERIRNDEAPTVHQMLPVRFVRPGDDERNA